MVGEPSPLLLDATDEGDIGIQFKLVLKVLQSYYFYVSLKTFVTFVNVWPKILIVNEGEILFINNKFIFYYLVANDLWWVAHK